MHPRKRRFCRTIFLQESNKEDTRFCVVSIFPICVHFVYLSADILTYFTRKKIQWFGAGGIVHRFIKATKEKRVTFLRDRGDFVDKHYMAFFIFFTLQLL